MKDIENYKLVRVQDALQRLDRALVRLESAAANAPGAAGTTALEEKLAHLNREHDALKQTAGHVAGRLDETIGRLSGLLED